MFQDQEKLLPAETCIPILTELESSWILQTWHNVPFCSARKYILSRSINCVVSPEVSLLPQLTRHQRYHVRRQTVHHRNSANVELMMMINDRIFDPFPFLNSCPAFKWLLTCFKNKQKIMSCWHQRCDFWVFCRFVVCCTGAWRRVRCVSLCLVGKHLESVWPATWFPQWLSLVRQDITFLLPLLYTLTPGWLLFYWRTRKSYKVEKCIGLFYQAHRRTQRCRHTTKWSNLSIPEMFRTQVIDQTKVSKKKNTTQYKYMKWGGDKNRCSKTTTMYWKINQTVFQCVIYDLSVNMQVDLHHGKKMIGRRTMEKAADWFLWNILKI